MAKKTHTGLIHGNDARTPKDFSREVILHETKLYWVDGGGSKYYKGCGYGVGKHPHFALDLDSIIKIA